MGSRDEGIVGFAWRQVQGMWQDWTEPSHESELGSLWANAVSDGVVTKGELEGIQREILRDGRISRCEMKLYATIAGVARTGRHGIRFDNDAKAFLADGFSDVRKAGLERELFVRDSGLGAAGAGLLIMAVAVALPVTISATVGCAIFVGGYTLLFLPGVIGALSSDPAPFRNSP